MTEACFHCGKPDPDFKCLGCREDVHRACVPDHKCADLAVEEEDSGE